ncbi:MAG: TorF family putative porin [Pseudomonadota bacterium]
MRRWGAAVLALCCWHGGAARAQVSGSAAIVSDYLYRGVSYSRGDPAVQLNVSYDSAAGWYAGAFASSVKLYGASRGGAQYIIYAGHARRLSSGVYWDAGLSDYRFTGAAGFNYREIVAGLGIDNVSARIAYAPDYLGQGVRTVYAELNGSYPVRDGWNLFAHLGYLHPLSGGDVYAYAPAIESRADGRAGVGANLAGWKWQLAWDGVHVRRAPYAQGALRSRGGVVLSATRPF